MRSATAFLLLTVLVSGCIFLPELHYDVLPYGDKQQSLSLSEQVYYQRYRFISAIGAGLLVGPLSDAGQAALGVLPSYS